MGRGRSPRTLELVRDASEILEEIHPASVRAVCYRLFVAGVIDSMSRRETSRVSRVLVDARERDEIPWSWIVDETRAAERPGTWTDPSSFADAALRSFRRDRWQYQPMRVEVWSEKGTVRGTLAPVLQEYGVTLRVFHGFSSATAIMEFVEEIRDEDRPLHALYVGDYDPSGLYMSEVDLPGRLARYGEGQHIHTRYTCSHLTEWDYVGRAFCREDDVAIHLERIALTRNDCEELPSFVRRQPFFRLATTRIPVT